MQKKIIFTLIILCASLLSFAQHSRIVSLAPSLTQSIYFLDAQDKIIGVTSYCTIAKDDKKEIIASAVKANLEKVVSLRPDLVLVSGFTSPEDIATLRKFGIAVEVFQSPKSFDEICKQFIRLGTLIGDKEKAENIVKESREKVEAIAAKRKHGKAPKMFFQIGANPLFTVIPNTFMADYIKYLSAENIAKNLKRGTVGREFVIANNPDYIFIVTMGIVGKEEETVWKKYTNLAAARKKQIFIIESDIACQPTPITFVQTMEILDKLIKP
ncbi:MAG: helical backbone metal receptor [Bacteroidia bacterium]|nr:helical backbone metal receptor [Bacteroidia bacterium]